MADKNYSETSFWQKLNSFAKLAGRKLVEKASIQLYYAANHPIRPSGQKVL